MPSFDAAAFWQWSSEHYAQKAVQQACLQLQDDFGLNVNLLLLSVYLQIQGKCLSPRHFSALERCIASDDRALRSHREARRQAKRGEEQAYRVMLTQELALERAQQQQLVDCVNAFCEWQTQIESNIRVYATYKALPEQSNALWQPLLNSVALAADSASD